MKLKLIYEDSRAITRSRFHVDLPDKDDTITKDPSISSPKTDDSDPRDLMGSPVYVSPERWKAWEKGEQFGKKSSRHSQSMPPFPYDDAKRAIKDPKSQVYLTLQKLGPLSWKELVSKIKPYRDKLESISQDVASAQDYNNALKELVANNIAYELDDGRFAAF